MQTNATDIPKINIKPRMQKAEISTPKPSPNQPVKLTPICVQTQSQKWMKTNVNTKAKLLNINTLAYDHMVVYSTVI